jgi:hypothetical protein
MIIVFCLQLHPKARRQDSATRAELSPMVIHVGFVRGERVQILFQVVYLIFSILTVISHMLNTSQLLIKWPVSS